METMSEGELMDLIAGLPGVLGTEEYQRLTTIKMVPDGIHLLSSLDPLGAAYRSLVTDIYHRISGRASYHAEIHEKSGIQPSANIWRSTSPFSFQSTKFVGEFLTAWGAIFDALDVKAGASVLEYGPGSGQALLLLARSGIKAYGVDIDAASTELLRQQSDAMGLDVSLEVADFGQGFTGLRFDRILFFEAFHHALQFDRLLLTLHDRLLPGGRLVFCGEPILDNEPSIPYPWGPRTDALSVHCMKSFGWMELGFTHDFFVSCLMKFGWLVTFIPSHSGRSAIYVAQPIQDAIPIGTAISLPSGWSVGEETHRWSVAAEAKVPLPSKWFEHFDLTVEMANYWTLPRTSPFLPARWRNNLL